MSARLMLFPVVMWFINANNLMSNCDNRFAQTVLPDLALICNPPQVYLQTNAPSSKVEHKQAPLFIRSISDVMSL
jgi:hypothetical protein